MLKSSVPGINSPQIQLFIASRGELIFNCFPSLDVFDEPTPFHNVYWVRHEKIGTHYVTICSIPDEKFFIHRVSTWKKEFFIMRKLDAYYTVIVLTELKFHLLELEIPNYNVWIVTFLSFFFCKELYDLHLMFNRYFSYKIIYFVIYWKEPEANNDPRLETAKQVIWLSWPLKNVCWCGSAKSQITIHPPAIYIKSFPLGWR